MTQDIRLHGYYRSSTSYRLRIALELKGLAHEYVPVNLLKSEQKDEAYRARNPFGSVPMPRRSGGPLCRYLVTRAGHRLTGG